MQFIGTYHTHNQFCDGAATIDDMVEAALAAGLQEIGISSHAPLPFSTDWNMPVDRLDAYARAVRDAQGRYAGCIRMYLGMELDYIPDDCVKRFQETRLLAREVDYYIGSVHFLGAGYPTDSFDDSDAAFRDVLDRWYASDVEMMARDFYTRVTQMLELPGIQIVGHFDRIKRWNQDRQYFRGDEPWYIEAADRALQAIARHGAAVELNTAAWRQGHDEPYPAPWMLERCRELGISIVVNSDAHAAEHIVDGFVRAHDLLAELHIDPVLPRLGDRSRVQS